MMGKFSFWINRKISNTGLLTGIFLGLLSFSTAIAQQKRPLNIVSPAQDISTVQTGTVYLKGTGDPGNFLLMNNQPVKIYSTGVFAAAIPLEMGQNEVLLKYGSGKDTLTRMLVITREAPSKPQPTAGFAIEYVKLSYDGDQIWLQDGEQLEVEMKASPGMKATFFKDIPMVEAPENQVGVAGIYRGAYKINASDVLKNQPITFTLLNTKTNQKVHSTSKQKVTFLTEASLLVGVSNKPRTPLAYGLGGDRLGGAKMGFVDSLVYFEITGKMQGMYRVRLAEQVQAYLDENDVDILPGMGSRPSSITGSWSVTSDNKNDYVSIGLSQRLPYVSKMEENPARLVVDIYGAVSNSNWITQREGLVAIKNVWYEQVSKDIFRAVIELQDNEHWGHEISYRGNSLSIRVKPKPKQMALRNLRIAVDAGHGGSNNGAIGLSGVLEKDLNLAMAKKLEAALVKEGATVVMTRSNDRYTTNTQRLSFLKEHDPDLLISIHCNAAGNPLVSGGSTYYRHQAFRPITQYIYKEMLKLDLADFGNVGGFNFTLNSPTEFPSVLVEVAFVSNPADEEKLLNPAFQDDIVKSIVTGVEKFLADRKQ